MKPHISLLSLSIFISLAVSGFGQNLNFERDRHKQILKVTAETVKKNYFDPTFKGVDFDERYKVALDQMTKAGSIGQMEGIIAQFLIDFDDSHLFYIPPGKRNKTDFGFMFRMYGDACLVYYVKKGSDAEAKGLAVGDQIYSIQHFAPIRENLWKIRYGLFALRPQPALNLSVIKPDGKSVEFTVVPKITLGLVVTDLTNDSQITTYIRERNDEYYKAIKQYMHEEPNKVLVWKIPGFSVDPEKVDNIIGKASKFPALIIDLRGNSGGRVDMCTRLIGDMFAESIKVADERRRKETKEIKTKGRGKDPFGGKLVVLIDSGSASASEMFARTIQLQKRGTIVGERSAGAVMESLHFSNQVGMEIIVPFGASVTIADMIMTDGRSLEKVGVTPDVQVITTGADLAANRDPAMAKAFELIGVKVTPEAAGTFFPPEDDKE